MKTKLTVLILSVCITVCTLCSCSAGEATTETSAVTGTTEPFAAADPAYPIIDADSFEELLADLRTAEADIAEIIRANGTLYYPTEVNENYYLFNVLSGERTELDFYFCLKNENTENELGDFIYVTIDYKERTLDDATSELTDDKHEYEVISEDSVYDKTSKKIYFAYGGRVHSIIIHEEKTSERSWRNFIEMKSMDITE